MRISQPANQKETKAEEGEKLDREKAWKAKTRKSYFYTFTQTDTSGKLLHGEGELARRIKCKASLPQIRGKPGGFLVSGVSSSVRKNPFLLEN
jgi:hypothetical protein